MCKIASTAKCRWRLQEITGVLQEECVFLFMPRFLFVRGKSVKCLRKGRKLVVIFFRVMSLFSSTLDLK